MHNCNKQFQKWIGQYSKTSIIWTLIVQNNCLLKLYLEYIEFR